MKSYLPNGLDGVVSLAAILGINRWPAATPVQLQLPVVLAAQVRLLVCRHQLALPAGSATVHG